jgi:hypothetical protein
MKLSNQPRTQGLSSWGAKTLGTRLLNNIQGTGHYLWWGVEPKRKVFLGKHFADPTTGKLKYFLHNLK